MKQKCCSEIKIKLEKFFLTDSEQEAFKFFNSHKECISDDEYKILKNKNLEKKNKIELQSKKQEKILEVNELILKNNFGKAYEKIAKTKLLTEEEKIKRLGKILQRHFIFPLNDGDAFKLVQLSKGSPTCYKLGFSDLLSLISISNTQFSNMFYMDLAKGIGTLSIVATQKISKNSIELLINKLVFCNSEMANGPIANLFTYHAETTQRI